MADEIFPWQKMIADEEARRSPNLIKRATSTVRPALTSGEVDALRREWKKLHEKPIYRVRVLYG